MEHHHELDEHHQLHLRLPQPDGIPDHRSRDNHLLLPGPVVAGGIGIRPGSTSKTCDYTPAGARLSQTTTDNSGTSTPGYYSYNAHSDVEAVTGTSGTTTATYGYTAYGNPVTSMFTGQDKNTATSSPTSTTQPYNSYRFNAMRWDSTTGQYDMGFRTYDPGLNQFTSRDMYNGALADMGLTTDPFTGSQYAFGGGNPISNIEFDGHTTCDQWGTCSATNTPVHVTSSQLGGPAKQNAYVRITKNVIVQSSDPYYQRMMTAYNAFLKGCPGCISAANGNISQQEWFWNDVCHVDQGHWCNPLFTAALADVSPLTPAREDQVFLMGSAFGADGFAEEPSSLPQKQASMKA